MGSQRASLARELIMSLDSSRDDSVEQAWNDENYPPLP